MVLFGGLVAWCSCCLVVLLFGGLLVLLFPVVCLEDSTEQSESNPGRSLGIKKQGGGSCLEDSTRTV